MKSAKMFPLMVSALLVSALLPGVSSAKVVGPDGTEPEVVWTREELERGISIRKLHETPEASYHIVRLATAEKPHTHERHDLTALILEGDVRMHMNGRSTDVGPGDLVRIPRGVAHWAENLGRRKAGEIYVVFTPPYDGKDAVPADKA